MWRVRRCINRDLAKYLYQSLIEPHYIYCQFINDACNIDMKRKLQVSQNKALHAILSVPNDYPSENLHIETGIEWLGVMRAKATCIETYKLLHNEGAIRTCSMISRYQPKRHLRSSDRVTVNKLRTRTIFAEGNLLVRGPRYWELLCDETRNAVSLNAFKNRIKREDCFQLPGLTHYKNIIYS